MTSIGTPVRRREDYRFLTGQGTYTDDINRAGQVYAYILRSPHASARVGGIDTSAAKASPGVVAVFTGADMAADGVGGLPCGWLIHSKDGSPMKEPAHPVLVTDRVRHVGDHVAVVIAESLAQAKDAAEKITVDYAVEPAVVDVVDALKAGAPQVFPEAPGNVCYDWHLGDAAAVDAALAGAARIVKLDLVNNRLVANAMEPRAAIGEYDRATGEHTLFTTSQNPHVIRLLMGAFVLHLPEARLRVVAPDVGGGFGSKIYHYAEEAIVTWAAAKVRRPVKWTAERSESFMSDAHGRDHATHVELGLDANAKFVALKVSTLANMGAYLSTFATCIPTYLYGTLLAGTYTTPAIYVETKAVFTNTVPVDAYRGAGRPEATYLLERIVDVAADETGIDPAELRRRNFIAADAFPYQTPVALQYDSGDYQTTLQMAQQAADYAGFEARRQEAARRGKLRGIGVATYIEACGIAPSAVAGALGARAGLYESAAVRFHPTGSVSVLTGSHSHGQGHETTFAQLVSDRLGVPIESVEIVHGDTGKLPFGMGTYGSRSLAVGGSAIVKAMDKIIAKGTKIAAHLLEASEADIEFKDGQFRVAGTDRSKSIGEVAFAAYVPHNSPIDEV
ncbi:MAG TPA: xanthine dehydrogenase family protein molybdopterin-binding subunit, partial [Stellaceae bacterium]|nr:xanthine dehydrogenase family protein molybdopterin-binding subunit [Stellaceae bacterium]